MNKRTAFSGGLFLMIFFFFQSAGIQAQMLSGTVIDAATGHPLSGVNISTKDQRTGTITDQNGRFELAVVKDLQLVCSFLGYRTQRYSVKGGELQEVIIYLKPVSSVLEEVEVSVTKNHLIPYKQAAAISVLSDTEIKDNISRTMAEAMMTVPGVWMQKTNHGGGSPFIRGLTGNYVLLLVDGIRMNNSTFRYGPNQYFNTISPFSVSSVEVLRGAGSTLYGSDAIGGTINIRSFSPVFDAEKRFGGNAGGQMLSRDMEYSGNLELDFSSKKFALLTRGSFRKFGDLYAGGDLGYERPTGYNEKDFQFTSAWKTGKNARLTASYQWLRQDDVPRYDKVAQKGYEYYNFTLQQRQLAYLRFDKKWNDAAVESMQLTYSYQQSNEERDTKKTSEITNKNERDDVITNGFAGQLNARLFDRVLLIAGADFYYDKIRSTRRFTNLESGETEEDSRGLYPDGSSAFTTGLFNNYNYETGNWNFQLGWRFNYNENMIEDETFGTLNQSSSSLVWNTTADYGFKSSHLYTSFNTAFRAPNINDISSLGDFDYGVEVPAPDLKAETSKNFELGYKVTGEWFSLNTAYFYTHIDDLIDRVKVESPPTGDDVYRKDNVGSAFITGFEADVKAVLPYDLSFRGSVTYSYGQNISKDEPFRRIPPLFGDLSLRYDSDLFFLALQTLMAGKQDRLSSGDIDDHRIPEGGTPGWVVLNIKSGMNWKDLSIHLALNNLFNEAYRMHGSGVDGPGRHLALSLNYHF